MGVFERIQHVELALWKWNL